MERLGADSGKMTLNICKFRIFLFKFKRMLRKYLPFPELERESILWTPFRSKLRKPHCRVWGRHTPQQGQSDCVRLWTQDDTCSFKFNRKTDNRKPPDRLDRDSQGVLWLIIRINQNVFQCELNKGLLQSDGKSVASLVECGTLCTRYIRRSDCGLCSAVGVVQEYAGYQQLFAAEKNYSAVSGKFSSLS